jgi:endonuclease/exonuclease/phosphatase family metal-dependent hydrolase
MRIVSWNLHGAAVPGRATFAQQQQAWRYMREELGADVILAQEVASKGIAPELRSEWRVVEGETGRFRKNWKWGSVIAASPEFRLQERKESYEDHWLAQLYDLVLIGKLNSGEAGT